MSFLKDASGPSKIWIASRDRAMLLTSSTTAFRGDSSRSLLWSDMYRYEVPMHAKGRGEKVSVSALQSPLCKFSYLTYTFRRSHSFLTTPRPIRRAEQTNTELSVTITLSYALLAQSLYYFLPISTSLMLLYPILRRTSRIQALGSTADGTGMHSTRSPAQRTAPWKCHTKVSWYFDSVILILAHVFQDHRSRVNQAYIKNDITITKVTHAGRPFTAKTAREYGASSEAVKALGGWSEGDSYRACYDRALPVKALLGAAMFDADHPEAHFLARESLRKFHCYQISFRMLMHLSMKSRRMSWYPNSFPGLRRKKQNSGLERRRAVTPRTLPCVNSCGFSSGSAVFSSRMRPYCTLGTQTTPCGISRRSITWYSATSLQNQRPESLRLKTLFDCRSNSSPNTLLTPFKVP